MSGSAAAQVREFPVPSAEAQPTGITTGPDGALWFTEFNGNVHTIGRITTTGAFTEYTLPQGGSEPFWITTGPDGNLWFTEYNASKIGKITPAGAITEYATDCGFPSGITVGPDGALWFTVPTCNEVGRISTAGAISYFPVSASGGDGVGITTGPDGNLWIAGGNGDNIERLTPSGIATFYSVPTSASLPYAITTGADGALWFTEFYRSTIGRITTAGAITEFPLVDVAGRNPWPRHCSSRQDRVALRGSPSRGAPSVDNNGWCADPVLIRMANAQPQGITVGPDGALWFTEGNGDKIGRLGPNDISRSSHDFNCDSRSDIAGAIRRPAMSRCG